MANDDKMTHKDHDMSGMDHSQMTHQEMDHSKMDHAHMSHDEMAKMDHHIFTTLRQRCSKLNTSG